MQGEQVKQLTMPGITPTVHHAKGDRDALDRYYTPQQLAGDLLDLLPWYESGPCVVLEPSIGGGAFARHVKAIPQCEKLIGVDLDPWPDWIVGNPPYAVAEEHVRKAIGVAPRVAFLLRLAFLESLERIPFWKEHPCRTVWVLSKRPSFTGGGSTDSCPYGFFFWDRSPVGDALSATHGTELRHFFPPARFETGTSDHAVD